jgi:hypothetical protein
MKMPVYCHPPTLAERMARLAPLVSAAMVEPTTTLRPRGEVVGREPFPDRREVATPSPYDQARQDVATSVQGRHLALQAYRAELVNAFSAAGRAHKIACDAGLGRHYIAQAWAVCCLAGMRLHRVVGSADADDVRHVRDDLQALWSAIDPLIEAIGLNAAREFNGVDKSLFRRQLEQALDGNATGNLDAIAELMMAEQRDAAE